jgi:hypothetical protein
MSDVVRQRELESWKFDGAWRRFRTFFLKLIENGNDNWFLYLGLLLSQFPFFDLRGSTWGAAFAIACCLAP